MYRSLSTGLVAAVLAMPVLAQTDRADLAREIRSHGIADLGEGRRQEIELNDCAFLTYTFGPDAAGEERLYGIATVDLATAQLGDPLFFAAYVEGLPEHGDYEKVFREGSDVMHLTQDDAPPGQLGIAAAEDHPILREEWVGRPRTASFVREGVTTPSPRDDGESYVFRSTDRLALTYLFEGGAAQLRALEAAVLTYQESYCR